MKLKQYLLFLLLVFISFSCKKDSDNTPLPDAFVVNTILIDNKEVYTKLFDVSETPTLTIKFSTVIDRTTARSISLKENGNTEVATSLSFKNNDSTVVLKPQSPLKKYTRYVLELPVTLQSAQKASLSSSIKSTFVTVLDSTDKFPRISDAELLTLVQRQTFKYFWDFGHPVSGLARERNSSGDLVTTGGSGFGIMAIVTGVHRNFITRQQGLERLQKTVTFLKTKADRYHGVFPHWLNGVTGKTIPFSTNDNGADLVETSFLMQGLLTARQYFDGTDPAETALRNDINQLWDGVEWNWFRKNNEKVLYWHWSPDKGWAMNMQIRGWNEALVTYVLAASSRTDAIPKEVYDNGWARNGDMRNGNTHFGYKLPLGPFNGGPLFWAHYSFLGINPNGLSDAYANYQTQVVNHAKINYEYSKSNPKRHYGYSDQNWGLTASDIPNGYTASEPSNDIGVIAPTAALASFPYTPEESMKALHFFYYKLGNRLWGDMGFYDAFSLKDQWFATSTLAIDQGPIIVMIENYRSGLLWDLFTSSPEVKQGMRNLGFQAPYL
jgi:hypothetical protein